MSSIDSIDDRKVVLITGVSDPSSLGACIALAFLNIGFRVFATARSRSAEELNIVKCAKEIKSRTGGVLDVLVNNASHMSRAPLLCTPIESFNNDWQANIIGPVRLTQLLALLLVHTAARADRGRPVVFNVGTAGGTIAVSWMAAQPAAKGALETISENEMRNFNVAVFCAKLGYIKTSIAFGEDNPFDNTSPNAPFYPDFMSKTVKRAQAVTNARFEAGSDPNEVARWIVRLCTGSGKGGIVWHASKAWILRWILPILPDWLLNLVLTASGSVDEVKTLARSKGD